MPCSLATMKPYCTSAAPARPSPSSFPCRIPLTSFPLPLPSAGPHSQPWSGPPPAHLPCPASLPLLISRLPPHFGARKAHSFHQPLGISRFRLAPLPRTLLPYRLPSLSALYSFAVDTPSGLSLASSHPSSLLSCPYNFPTQSPPPTHLPAFCKLAQGPHVPVSGHPRTSVSQGPAGRREQPVVGSSGAGWQALQHSRKLPLHSEFSAL